MTIQYTNSNISSNFEVYVAKQNFKFHAAHFVAFRGFRERLHGHNYQLAVRLIGSRHICNDGYVLDYGDVKRLARKVCKSLDEHFLCPMYSDVMKITQTQTFNEDCGGSIEIECEDGAKFVFPKKDCVLLPIVHATTEELAIYIWGRLLSELDTKMILDRGIHTMEITVAEATGQEAVFRREIPEVSTEEARLEEGSVFDVRTYIRTTNIVPTQCLDDPGGKNINQEWEKRMQQKKCCESCLTNFSKQLEKLADAINAGQLQPEAETGKKVTVADIQTILNAK